MREQRILFLGAGHLGGQILDLFLRIPGNHRFLVGGRNLAALQQRVNLSRFSALQLGFHPQVECLALDLNDVSQTASVIASFRPDVIFCAATFQPLAGISEREPSFVQRLAAAPIGPRLPFALLLVAQLMRGVRLAGMERPPKVLNAMFPDMIHPILANVNLAPTTGIGDLANNVPALRLSLAEEIGVPFEQIDVRLVMARWVSYWLSRTSLPSAPFHVTVLVQGKEYAHQLKSEPIFARLRTSLKRVGGDTGLLMTATSARLIFEALLTDREIIAHVPGPNGLPGGYPVRVTAEGVALSLPSALTRAQAIQINEEGLKLDGIERIGPDGTLFLTDEAASLYKDLLGYECHAVRFDELGEWVTAFQERYTFARSKEKPAHLSNKTALKKGSYEPYEEEEASDQ